MRIAVTTPTGKVGSRVTQLLIQAGVRPVLLVRNPSRLDRRWSSGPSCGPSTSTTSRA